jgi:probable rRNA maturation factor
MTAAKKNKRASVDLVLQIATDAAGVPDADRFERWAVAALEGRGDGGLVIRVVDEAESRDLNRRYRHKDKPTNVLSFPFEPVPGIDETHLGDLVICAPVVQRQAVEQGKTCEAHWAHMVVHGVLHLLGYDHETDTDAGVMEALETGILHTLGHPDPYE